MEHREIIKCRYCHRSDLQKNGRRATGIQRWTWYAMKRKSGIILAWHNGKRRDKDFLALWQILSQFSVDFKK